MLLEWTFYAWKSLKFHHVLLAEHCQFLSQLNCTQEPNIRYHLNSLSAIGSFEANKLILIMTCPMTEPNIMIKTSPWIKHIYNRWPIARYRPSACGEAGAGVRGRLVLTKWNWYRSRSQRARDSVRTLPRPEPWTLSIRRDSGELSRK